MNRQLKADLMLLLVTLCWGLSYVAIDICVTEIMPLALNAYRFLIAFFVIAVISFNKIKSVNRTTIKYSAVIGIILTAVYISVTYGVMYTSVSNAGFLCALTVIITPVMTFFIKRERPEKKLIAVLLMCLVGIGLMTLNEELKPALGDILCIICAFTYAVDLMFTEKAVRDEEVDAFQFGVFQLGFAGAYLLGLSLLLEKPCMPHTPKVWIAVLFLAIFCTGVAFVVQAVAQQYTSATHVGIIYSLEPVFSAIAAFFIAGEILLPRGYAGAVLMLAGTLLMEIDISEVTKKYKSEKI